VGDDRKFDNERYVPTWETGYRLQGQVGPIDSLLVNQGFERFVGGRVGSANPTLHGATLFSDLLARRGVLIEQSPGMGSAPSKGEEIAFIESQPVSVLVGEMLTESDNTTAEMLLKSLSLQSSEDELGGNRIGGSDHVRRFLDGKGIRTEALKLVDGSGLDRGDRATCGSLADVLNTEAADGLIASSLAKAAESGTLKDRMVGTEAVGRVKAKTGSLLGVSALAGWAYRPGAAPVSFASINNAVDTETARRFEDRFAALLAAGSASPAPSVSDVIRAAG